MRLIEVCCIKQAGAEYYFCSIPRLYLRGLTIVVEVDLFVSSHNYVRLVYTIHPLQYKRPTTPFPFSQALGCPSLFTDKPPKLRIEIGS
jgi:hypothetical protein